MPRALRLLRRSSTLASRSRSSLAEELPRRELLRSARVLADAVEVVWDDDCTASFHHICSIKAGCESDGQALCAVCLEVPVYQGMSV